MEQAAAAEAVSFGMNTYMEYRVFGENAQEALLAGIDEVKKLESKLSRFIPSSEISRINANAGKKSVKVTKEVYEVLSNAAKLCIISQGLFDVMVAPLIDLWDYKNASEAPKEQQIQKTLTLVNSRDMVLNRLSRTVKLQKLGQSIDMGGIAKGFASDRFIESLKKFGITSAFINIGGNVSALGNRPDGSPWRVGIRHPRQEGCLLGTVEVNNLSVVTSGDYERFFIDGQGNRYHHLLNPISGYPAMSGLISVTIIAKNALLADALSTMVFVAGLEKGLQILAQFTETEAVLVDEQQQVYITKSLKECYQTAAGIKLNMI